MYLKKYVTTHCNATFGYIRIYIKMIVRHNSTYYSVNNLVNILMKEWIEHISCFMFQYVEIKYLVNYIEFYKWLMNFYIWISIYYILYIIYQFYTLMFYYVQNDEKIYYKKYMVLF